MIENCTRCSKPLTDVKIFLDLKIEIQRLQPSGIWEEIPNSKLQPKEILCTECFDKFSEALSKGMSTGD